MKRQSKSYWCGVASIANALEVLGIRRSQREIARLCDVNSREGTSEVEMKRALLANGVKVDEFLCKNNREAEEWLWLHLGNRGPAVLCVDDDSHWVTAIGICSDAFILFDPSRNAGVEILSDVDLYRRWENSDCICYGIGISL